MKKQKSLRKRWLLNTVGIVVSLGLVCVLLVSILVGYIYYTDLHNDIDNRVQAASGYLTGLADLTAKDHHSACVSYTGSFRDRSMIELQYISPEGLLLASSYGKSNVPALKTEDFEEALRTGSVSFASSDDGYAASLPVYCQSEPVGVFRFVSPTDHITEQILEIGISCIIVLVIIAVLAALMTDYSVRSTLRSVEEITEKAKRIAGGTYGIQIKTKHNDEIGELAETINELSSQVARNEKTQTEFISSLSHELRTPLTAITGWSETLLNDESLDADARRGIKIIYGEARRLTEMVVDLLDFTRIQDGRMTLNMQPADLLAEFEDTVFMYSSRLAQDGITLNYIETLDDIPEITCDAQRLRQVFLNILDNAAKHGGEGKTIEASIHYIDDAVQVRIRDFGPGIPEDEIPLVKRKFFKGSSKARGSGIGLAVCDEIIQMHGGTLTLTNAQGGGTLVCVTVPAHQ